jgi:hypothetical protein
MARTRQTFAAAGSLWSWRHRILKSDLPPEVRLVLHTLACRMNDTSDDCFSTARNLVSETGLPLDIVIQRLREAAEFGWIDVREVEPKYFQVTRCS